MKKGIFKKALCLILCVIFAFSCFVFSVGAEGEEGEATKLDLIFVIDTNKSMTDYLWYVMNGIDKSLDELEIAFSSNIDYRIAFVDYRDFKRYTSDSNYTFTASEFMTDRDEILNYLYGLRTSDYDTGSSCLFHALIDGVKELDFREDASRAVIVVGGNTPRDPESKDTGYDYSNFLFEFTRTDKDGNTKSDYVIDTINVEGNEVAKQKLSNIAHSANGLVYGPTGKTSLESSMNFIFKSIFQSYPSNLQAPPPPEPVLIYYGTQRIFDYVNCRVPLFESYSHHSVKLSYIAKGKSVDHVVWSSSNPKITIDQQGNVVNTGKIFGSSEISADAYDKDDNLLSTQTVKIRFYKLSIFLLFI